MDGQHERNSAAFLEVLLSHRVVFGNFWCYYVTLQVFCINIMAFGFVFLWESYVWKHVFLHPCVSSVLTLAHFVLLVLLYFNLLGFFFLILLLFLRCVFIFKQTQKVYGSRWEVLERVGGGEVVTRIYCIKTIYFQKWEKNKNILKLFIRVCICFWHMCVCKPEIDIGSLVQSRVSDLTWRSLGQQESLNSEL